MKQRAMSLMDVLAPPGNTWLIELSRRKSDLPEGVHIVRFSDAEDDLAEEGAQGGKMTKRGKLVPA